MAEDLGPLVSLQLLLAVTADTRDGGEVVQFLAVDSEAVDLLAALEHLERGNLQHVAVGHIISCLSCFEYYARSG